MSNLGISDFSPSIGEPLMEFQGFPEVSVTSQPVDYSKELAEVKTAMNNLLDRVKVLEKRTWWSMFVDWILRRG